MNSEKPAAKFSTTKACQGFTLVELMVTLTIVTILLAIATPAMTTLFNKNRASTAAQNFMTAIDYARAESMKRSGALFVSVGPNDGSYAKGWSVFVNSFDTTGGAPVPYLDDSAPAPTSERTLSYYPAPSSNVSVIDRSRHMTSGRTVLSFTTSGENAEMTLGRNNPALGSESFAIEFTAGSGDSIERRCVRLLSPGYITEYLTLTTGQLCQ